MANVTIPNLPLNATPPTTSLFEISNGGISESVTLSSISAAIGSQTPWLQDIVAAGFDLRGLSNLEFNNSTEIPGGNVIAIYVESSNLNLNVVGPDSMILKFGGTTEYSIDASEFNFLNNNLIGLGFGEFSEITTPTVPATNNVRLYGKLDSGVTKLFYLQEDGTEVGPLTSASTSQTPWLTNVNAAGFALQNLSRVAFTQQALLPGDTHFITRLSSGMIFGISGGQVFQYNIGGSDQYEFSNTEIDMRGNNMTDFGFIESNGVGASFPDTGVIRLGNLESIVWGNAFDDDNVSLTVGASDNFTFKSDGVDQLTISTDQVSFHSNPIVEVTDFSLSGNINFPNGVRQIFNPDDTTPGLNVGSQPDPDPTAPINGDLYYNSTSESLRARINGAWIDLGAVSGITSINGDTTAAQIIAGGTGIDIDEAGATHTIVLNAASTDLTDSAILVRNNQSNTYTAGAKQIFVANATTAGLNINAQLPSSLAVGDIYRTAEVMHFIGTTATDYILVSNGQPTSYTAGARQDFLGLLAGSAGLNVGGIAGTPTTQVNGDIWLDTSTNQIFGRINGADVDLGSQGGGTSFIGFTADDNLDMGNFGVIFTSDITGISGTLKYIANEFGTLWINANSGSQIDLAINNSSIMTVDAGGIDLSFLNVDTVKAITFGGSAVTEANSSRYIQYDNNDSKMHFNISGNSGFFYSFEYLQVVHQTFSTTTILQNAQNATAILELEANHTSPVASLIVGKLDFYDDSDTGNRNLYGTIQVVIEDATDGSEGGSIQFRPGTFGSTSLFMEINNANDGTVDLFVPLDMNGQSISGIPQLTQENSANQNGFLNLENAARMYWDNNAGTESLGIAISSGDELDLVTTSGLLRLTDKWITNQTAHTGSADATNDRLLIFDNSNGDIRQIAPDDLNITISQTPWLSLIDADRFNLDNTGAIIFSLTSASTSPLITDPYIEFDNSLTPDTLILNVPGGAEIAFYVNGVEEFSFNSNGMDCHGNSVTNITGLQLTSFIGGLMTMDRDVATIGTAAGSILFSSEGDEYGRISTIMTNISPGDETGEMIFSVSSNSQDSPMITLLGDSADLANSLIDFNSRIVKRIPRIDDENDNQQLIFGFVNSAVNHLQITNSITATAPILESVGDDTDIDLELTPKGTGHLTTVGNIVKSVLTEQSLSLVNTIDVNSAAEFEIVDLAFTAPTYSEGKLIVFYYILVQPSANDALANVILKRDNVEIVSFPVHLGSSGDFTLLPISFPIDTDGSDYTIFMEQSSADDFFIVGSAGSPSSTSPTTLRTFELG